MLTVIGGEIARWDIERGTPYQCVLDVARGAQPMTVQVSLAPRVDNMVIDGRERRDIDGILVYLDRAFCSAESIVGPQMQRRLAAGLGLRGPARHRDRAHGHRRQRRRGLRHRRAHHCRRRQALRLATLCR